MKRTAGESRVPTGLLDKCLERVQLRRKFRNSKITCLHLLGFPLPCRRVLNSAGTVQCGVLQAEYHDSGCAHAVPSWINTLFYTVFATSSHFLPSLTFSLLFAPSSTQCRTMMTTTLPHKTMTHWIILLRPPPTTLSLPPPAHQKAARRPVADGLTTKSSSSSTMLNQIAL